MPKFIGPYKILKAMNESSNVTLELPQEFKDRKINPTFHTNLVRPYIKNDDILFPKRDTKVFYDFGNDEDQEWLCHDSFVLVNNHLTFTRYFPSLHSLGSQDGYLGICINSQVYLPSLPAISISHPHHHHCFTTTTVADPYNPPRTSL